MVILTCVRCYLIVVLIFISLIISNIEHLFLCLFALWMSYLETCLFRSSDHFWLDFFLDIELHELYVNLGDESLVNSIICEYFLPFCKLPFHFVCGFKKGSFTKHQIRSVAQSCLTLCDPMNCSTPGLPVPHQLPEFTQTQVHQVSDAIQPSHPLSYPSPPAPNPSQHQGLFQWVNSSHEVAKVLELQL